jgi:hypothetical protein
MPTTKTATSSNTPRTRTITMFDRPPVRIQEEAWPLLCKVDRGGGGSELRATLAVRHHEDGRRLVYARYVNDLADVNLAGGLLIETDDPDVLISTIRQVAKRCGCEDLIDELVGKLPATDLD